MSTLDALLDAIGAAPVLPGARCRSRTPMRKCTVCQKHSTRANAGICYRCKPVPDVSGDGDMVYIDGLGHMTTGQALKLAHAIADECTP